MQYQNKFFISGVFSYLLWGFLPIILKNLHQFNSTEIIFYRTFFAFLLLIPFLLLTKDKSLFNLYALFRDFRQNFWKMLILNIIGSALLMSNWVSYAYVVNNVSIQTASAGYLILPITTSILAFIILKEKLKSYQWIAIGLSSVSCYFMSHVNIGEVVYLLVIALSFSFYMISQRKNVYTSRMFNLAIQMMVGVLIMYCFTPSTVSVSNLNPQILIYFPILALFFTITPLFLNTFALNGMKASTLSFLGYLNPIFGFIIGAMIYNEGFSSTKLISYGMLALSLCIFNWQWILALVRRKSNTLKNSS